MAIYSCRVQTISRSKGRSATAAAAYRSGTSIEDIRTGEIHNYTNRGGVETTGIVLPSNAPRELYQRDTLWNEAEAAENRKNSTVAREVLVAVPHELDQESRQELIENYAKHLSDRYQTGVDYAIHEPDCEGDNRNYHAHILMTTRRIDEQGFGAKTRELDEIRGENPRGRLEVNNIRQTWEEHANNSLERSGKDERIDSRSLKEQGIDRQPTVHIGPSGNALDRRNEFSERAELNKQIRDLNKERVQALRELKQLHKEQRELSNELSGLYKERKEANSDLRKAERLKPAVDQVNESRGQVLKDLQAKHDRYQKWHDREIEKSVGDYHSFSASEPTKKKWFERQEKFEQRKQDFEIEKAQKFESMHRTISEHRAPTMADAVSKSSSKAAYDHKIKKTEIEANVYSDISGQVEEKSAKAESIQKQISERSEARSHVQDRIKSNRALLAEVEKKTADTQKQLESNTNSFTGDPMNQDTEIFEDNMQANMTAANKQEAAYYQGVVERQDAEAMADHKAHFEKLEQPELDNLDQPQDTSQAEAIEVSSERQEIDSMLNKAEEKQVESEQSQEKEEDDLGY
ncbi:MobQ family relaxase [Arenicella xantha]|uniref:MobA/MobL family protein n=1 Tax=Arenicella xantha TaxID=644221 RepID=A0A395JSL3_9GAMM|nr:MobQ family relaxase [Arenicella xantha]RBP53525.1 MobA/MobL family protein [Arenicella xantha]